MDLGFYCRVIHVFSEYSDQLVLMTLVSTQINFSSVLLITLVRFGVYSRIRKFSKRHMRLAVQNQFHQGLGEVRGQRGSARYDSYKIL